MIYEKIDSLCKENGTNITALCKEITGSSGNLPTWKKGNIRLGWLIAICQKFNISSDYLLGLQGEINNLNPIMGKKILEPFLQLNEDNQDIIIGETKKLLREQRKEEAIAVKKQYKQAT